MKTIIGAAAIALLLTLVGTHFFIKFLTRRGYGQFIRDDGPTTHSTKRGTPTMGGAVIIAAVVIAYFLAHLVTWRPISASSLLLLGLMVATGVLGFMDDWAKITNQRSLGLTARGKIVGQVLIGVAFGVLSLQFPDARGISPASPNISFTRDISWPFDLNSGVVRAVLVSIVVIWVTLLIIATSNAVNLTDGLDGLATGASTMVFASYFLISYWQFNQWCGRASTAGPRCYEVRDPHDLAVVSLAIAGACFGFLWWNAKPAQIFLGDTGSLALGAAVGGMAIMTRTEILLIVIGGLFVIETLSVLIQTSYFKLTGGKRVFKMAPIHHHFEMLGWNEVTVVIRFWIICGLFVAAGFALFYGEWVLGQ